MNEVCYSVKVKVVAIENYEKEYRQLEYAKIVVVSEASML